MGLKGFEFKKLGGPEGEILGDDIASRRVSDEVTEGRHLLGDV